MPKLKQRMDIYCLLLFDFYILLPFIHAYTDVVCETLVDDIIIVMFCISGDERFECFQGSMKEMMERKMEEGRRMMADWHEAMVSAPCQYNTHCS